jgi:hypothetical protein
LILALSCSGLSATTSCAVEQFGLAMMFFLVNAPANYAVRRHTGDDEEESEGQLVEVKPRLPVKSGAKDPAERTDDPVRMYLRERARRISFRARVKSQSPNALRPAARR